MWNESFFSAPQLKRISLGGGNGSSQLLNEAPYVLKIRRLRTCNRCKHLGMRKGIDPVYRTSLTVRQLARTSWCSVRDLCQIDDSTAAVIRGVLVLDSVRIVVPDSQKEYFAYTSAANWATDLRLAHPESGWLRHFEQPGRSEVRMGGRPVVRDGLLIAVGLNNWRYRQDSTGLAFELYVAPA